MKELERIVRTGREHETQEPSKKRAQKEVVYGTGNKT